MSSHTSTGSVLCEVWVLLLSLAMLCQADFEADKARLNVSKG
jgi:hypothetical protein